ncbi:SUMF1/EgtB/PvdO family nonheme iron enzyme [Cryobacterium sp. N19]|uniref:SUMF1/EgtB/PvdO family nonheme iron enzyme n=1 Tax=Cryobacterium sp. N19 TaxID=2048288 RepID=UPI000CE4D4A4|nr:SUMF1/EgtB/PvdO family nonheme iron enzyme [Cryobacterium sp. N19]
MSVVFDADEANTNEFNPLVARGIDLPTMLGPDGIDDAAGDVVKIFSAPDDAAEWPAWRERLTQWRATARTRLAYSGAAYDDDNSRWARTCFSVALVWLWDERLYDHTTGQFTVDAFLAGATEYGGFDGIVLWHAYPIIGIDDRNQFDFYRDVVGIADLVSEFHRNGLKVFINYNPWDTGTRRAPGDDPAELARLVGELVVDGVFLDTMKEGGTDLINALISADPPQVLEGESRIQLSRIEDHHLSWAQWFADSEAPGVLRAHWYERRHMMHHTRRWNRDHAAELQSSFMNGTGMLIWDAVFGVWVGWNERDKATLRRMLRLQRALSDVLVDGEWMPLIDAAEPALAARVYVSRFRTPELTLWTIVNRSGTDYHGPVLSGTGPATVLPERLIDLGTGAVLDAEGTAVTVPARGITAVVAVTGPDPSWLAALLQAENADSAAHPTPTSSFPARAAVRVPPPATATVGLAPAHTVSVRAGERTLRIRYRRRETGLYQGAPYVDEWKPLPPRLHDDREETMTVLLSSVAVATTEVTVAEFEAFLEATGYRPLIPNRFLGDPDSGLRPTTGTDPVTLVNLADARAYAHWVGGRLPSEFEWQVAAADPALGRLHPLVWNWTESEHSDGITRFVMLKGGSSHEPAGSDWYFDGGPREREFTAKFLLPGLGLDRSENIGFRVCWDLAAGSTS